jgi:acyl carrier protein
VTTLQRLQTLLQKDLDLKLDLLQPQAQLADLEIDSLRMIEILFSVEDEFKVKVPSDQGNQAKLQTVIDLVNYIDALVSEQQHTALGAAAGP